MDKATPLEGEGETKFVMRVRERIGCDEHGEPADQRHTFLLDGGRANPASSAYRRDDCTWCSDHEVFSCPECRKQWWNGRPVVDGHKWCSTFFVDRHPHLFLRWREREIPDPRKAEGASP